MNLVRKEAGRIKLNIVQNVMNSTLAGIVVQVVQEDWGAPMKSW